MGLLPAMWLNGAFICVLLVLLEACRQCGSEALRYLGTLKDAASLESADCTAIRNCLSRIATIGEVRLSMAWGRVEGWREAGESLVKEKLGDTTPKSKAGGKEVL